VSEEKPDLRFQKLKEKVPVDLGKSRHIPKLGLHVCNRDHLAHKADRRSFCLLQVR
jgi:hypothetical protein